MTKVRISKIQAVEGGLPPNPKNQHVDGEIQKPGFSLPIEYTIEGTLLFDIKVGESVRIFRTKRNGVDAEGLFTTSPVTEVKDGQFTTKNSVYLIETLNETNG